MNLFGFGQTASIDVILHGCDNRKYIEVRNEDGTKDKYYVYYDGESISGQIVVSLKKNANKLEHQGIKVEFIGSITLFVDRGNNHEFISITRDLVTPGTLVQNISLPFEFMQVEKPFESYSGNNVILRYFIRVTIIRRMSDIVKELDILVHTLSHYPDIPQSLKMEVGIEDSLHIEFEYNKPKYHLKDVIIGKIYFLLVRIKVKNMELHILKRETTGYGSTLLHDNETIRKFEIMDGAPVKGESIPIRLFLTGQELTPTLRDINKKFSVRYFLNLVLVDEEDRRYYKEQEIVLYRKSDLKRPPIAQPVLNSLLHQAQLQNILLMSSGGMQQHGSSIGADSFDGNKVDISDNVPGEGTGDGCGGSDNNSNNKSSTVIINSNLPVSTPKKEYPIDYDDYNEEEHDIFGDGDKDDTAPMLHGSKFEEMQREDLDDEALVANTKEKRESLFDDNTDEIVDNQGVDLNLPEQ